MPTRRGKAEIYTPDQGQSFGFSQKSEGATFMPCTQIKPFTFYWSFKCVWLVQELKEAFEAEGTDCDRLIITATVSADRKTIDASYEVETIAM